MRNHDKIRIKIIIIDSILFYLVIVSNNIVLKCEYL